MKKYLNIKNITLYSFVILSLFIFGYGFLKNNPLKIEIVNAANNAKDVNAAKECNGSYGNIDGYVDTENLGRIYLNTQSWNRENPADTTTLNFFVDYDRQTGMWSGRGWNKQVGWVDFSYNQLDKIVQFKKPGNNPDQWGNWNGEIDLSNVGWDAQYGSFQGTGIDSHNDSGGYASDIYDDKVGSGEWTFDNVVFISPDQLCPQNINVFINGSSNLHRDSCDIPAADMDIQWTTENIVPGSCTSVQGTLWNAATQNDQNTGTSIHPNGPVTGSNAPVIFKLRCTGLYSNSPVEGIATASCGTNVVNDPNNPNGIVAPIFKEA